MHREETFRIGFGSVCIEIHCRDQEFLEKWRANYRPFLVSRQPDFRINFKLRNKLTAPEVKHLLANSWSYLEGNRFFTKPELMEQRIDWAGGTLWVDTERELLAPEVDYKLMNVLIRGIYSGIYAKLRKTTPDAHIVHGCGIIDGKRCYLFTGPSGSGKSTVAKLAERRKILNDEAILIGRNKEGFYLTGTPIDGEILNKCNTSAHLSAILFLRHDTRVSLRKLGRVETYLKLITQVFDTSPLLEIAGADSLKERAELSAEVANGVLSYELGFRPDSSFWQVVENI